MTAQTPRIVVVTGLAFEAEIAGPAGANRICCGQPARLTSALRDAVAEGCSGIISFGIAAGLDPKLRPGSVLIASEVVEANGDAIPTDEGWRAALLEGCRPAAAGRLLGVDRPVVSAKAKEALRAETGAVALDMESHIAAAYAAAYRLPFAVLRAIADPATGSVPRVAIEAMRPDGHADIAAVLAALVRRPGELLPLIRIARETRRARRALVKVRGRLGSGFGLVDLG